MLREPDMQLLSLILRVPVREHDDLVQQKMATLTCAAYETNGSPQPSVDMKGGKVRSCRLEPSATFRLTCPLCRFALDELTTNRWRRL
jgi:hypothetical protein